MSHRSALLIIHPDFPWSGACVIDDISLQSVCLPALRRIVAAARRRKSAHRQVVLVPFHRPEGVLGEAGVLLSELLRLASLTAPPRLNAITARRWLATRVASHGPFEACGFWTDRCVTVISQDVCVKINPRLGAVEPALTEPRPDTQTSDAAIARADMHLSLVQLSSGAWRQRAPEPADFHIGQVISDGIIQRYILAMHPSFEDDHRIRGDYVLVNLPIAEVPESEWELSEERAAAYAAMTTPLPPVVLDHRLSFVDGGHRHAAAQLRGASYLAAFVPVAIAAKYLPS